MNTGMNSTQFYIFFYIFERINIENDYYIIIIIILYTVWSNKKIVYIQSIVKERTFTATRVITSQQTWNNTLNYW